MKGHGVFVLSSNTRSIAIVLLNLYVWFLCFSQQCCAGDTLKPGEKIIGNETSLVSGPKKFKLGFFSAGGAGTYLGIWYAGSEPETQTVVWVGNRENPIGVDSTGVFEIAEDGNLVVSDTRGKTYWSSELKASSPLSTNRIVKLMDSGNLVLVDEQLKMNLWESFDHPTDTFLPGMNVSLELSCWRSPQDPGRGNFTFKMLQTKEKRYAILNHNQLYWESENEIQRDLMKDHDDDMSDEVYQLLSSNITQSVYEKRLFINSTGYLQFLLRDNQNDYSPWLQPKSSCLIYNYCGYFASCNDNSENMCECLPGFDSPPPKGEGDLRCARKTESCDEDSTTFLNLVMVKVGIPDEKIMAENEAECRSVCLKKCLGCQAYSYKTPASESTCWIWTQNLSTLKEEYHSGDGRNIFVRVHKSDIAPTPKTCEPCGTNMVPYPLSTGTHCGDPTYFHFICNKSTLQLSFFTTTTMTDSHVVTSIEPELRKFSIQINVSHRCNAYTRNSDGITISPPFDTTSNNSCSDQVEVNWQPPSEPTCAESTGCHGWNHSTCRGNRCLCNANYYWNVDLLTCSQGVISPPISTIEKPKGKESTGSSLSLILGTTLTGVVTLACIIVIAFVCRRKIALKLRQDKENIRRNRGRFYDSERHVQDLIDMEVLEEKDNEGIEVPYFDFESILEATDHFSEANKLGKGGYGQVYKGKLEGDPTKSVLLEWPMRFDIILGVARGLLYLHQDSRLRVIHRDLKTSNILLDGEMQPKISDFGLARIFAGKETEASTQRVVGTYGYMSPEYALDGLFSTKSDVFSFGVQIQYCLSYSNVPRNAQHHSKEARKRLQTLAVRFGISIESYNSGVKVFML
ncbi:hypothetical protein VNO77_36852 [Canavalia gladiata]|uniref:Receptor-like serine/threonine-protein kinase n=1 Tax=Canavalia gladiata TaxID=3824 RepID=A0AAN9K9Y0_CANGL